MRSWSSSPAQGRGVWLIGWWAPGPTMLSPSSPLKRSIFTANILKGIKYGVCNQYSTSNIMDHWSLQSRLPTLSVWRWASHLTRTVYYFHKHTSRLGISSGYEGLMMANTWSEMRESRAWWPERRRGRISWYSGISPGQWTASWIWSWGRAPAWPCFGGDPTHRSQ